MPIVTVDPSQYERKELKSAPADPNVAGDEPGFIMVRPLPYGMKLVRDEKATRLISRAVKDTVSGENSGGGKGRMRQQAVVENIETELKTANAWANGYDFAYCIGDHNLTDHKGNKIDFTQETSVRMLNPRVGQEIEDILFKVNNEEDAEKLEDFLKRSTTSLEDEEVNSRELSPTDQNG